MSNSIPETKSAGGLVLNQIGQILMVEEYGRYWGLPRGHIEAGEDELAAATREIAEETGITDLTFCFDLGHYTRSTFDVSGTSNHKEIKHMTFFCFKTSQTELKPSDKNISNACWVNLDQAVQKLINEKDIEFLLSATQQIKANGLS